jgi:hypothetical protein
MLRPVDLDHKPGGRAIEIDDIPADNPLPVKLEAV